MKDFHKFCVVIILIIFSSSSYTFSQDFLVTNTGDIFECLVEDDRDDSIYFSISMDSLEYSVSMHKSNILFRGKTELFSSKNKAAAERDDDIIITKTGEVLKCNITKTQASSLSYSFSVGNNEIKNIIPRDKVAYFKKSYLSTLDLEEETTEFVMANYYEEVLELPAWINDEETLEKDLIGTLKGEIFKCSIKKDEDESVHFTIPYMGTNIGASLLKDQIAYSGKVRDLLPSSLTSKEEDMIITTSGELLKCNITSIMETSLVYSFFIGKSEISNTIPREKVVYFKRSYLKKIDLDRENTKFVAKNLEDDVMDGSVAHNDSLTYSKDLIITREGDLLLCKIEEEREDSVLFSMPDMIEKISASLLRKDIVYLGKASLLNLSDHEGKDGDLIITMAGELLKCKITSTHEYAITYSFYINGNEMKASLTRDKIAYFQKSNKSALALEKESLKYFTRNHLNNPNWFAQNISGVKDLIVPKSGNKIICKIENIDLNRIYYTYYDQGKKIQKNISKLDVEYYVNDSDEKTSGEKMYIPDFEKDQEELIITKNGKYYQGEIIDVGFNSVEIKIDGIDDTRYFKMDDIVYYGKSFLNTIKDGNKLQHPKYLDLIYKNNNSVLLCSIAGETPTGVRYSFVLNNKTYYNEIPISDIVYYGVNIFNSGVEDNAPSLAQTNIGKQESKEDVAVSKPELDKTVEAKLTEIESDQTKTEERDDPLSTVKNIDSETKEAVAQEVEKTTPVQLPPELILFAPEIASKGNFKSVENEVSSINISGVLIASAKIDQLLINGARVNTTENGKFEYSMLLAVGKNNIEIKARDENSNELSERYNITREEEILQEAVVAQERDTDPPELQITYPRLDAQNGSVTVSNKTKRIQISGKVEDASGVFEVMVNNMDATLSASGAFQVNIPLRIGKNTLTVKASDLFFNDAVKTFVIDRQDVSAQAEAPQILEDGGAYYAMLIGVSDYSDPYIPNLDENPINDAVRLSDALKNHYFFDEENVFLMENPVRSDILRTFDRLNKIITDKDNLLIFFAGHGYYDDQTELGYWLPSDAEAEFTANWIYNDVLVANLKRIKSKHTLLISDACFSGSIFKTRAMPSTAGIAYQKKYDLSSRKAITSGVLQSVPNESIFFKYFIEFLENNREPVFSASELFRNIEIPIGNNSPNSPLYGVIQNVGDEGGDFIFLRR